MRRLLAIVGTLAATGGLLLATGATGDDGGPYELRAIFDNGGFLVPGEEVRIAGAKVGEVVEVDVSREDEIVSLEGGEKAIPGKAVVVMRIDDEAFHDFREDAECLIRPQSLLGERFVQCRHTQPRAAGTEPPPPLPEIPEGQPGEGQHLLPLENNGKQVDLDLIQNINRRPYAERFRLILNDLGAGLAARGDELAEIIERSNPALRETNEVLAILAAQNRALADLARDSDTVLEPLARERRHLTGFIRNATIPAQATAERRGDLEAGFAKFPGALRELRSTMVELEAFANQATPVLADLGAAAPDLTRATELLEPFSKGSTTALTSLGDAAAASGPLIRDSDPVIVDLRDLARATKPAAKSLAGLLSSLRESGGYDRLMELILFTTGGLNGFDSLGHYLRALLLVTNCVDYVTTPLTGCSANWAEEVAGGSGSASKAEKKKSGGDDRSQSEGEAEPLPPEETLPIPGFEIPIPEIPGVPETPEEPPPAEPEPPAEEQPPAEPGEEPSPEPEPDVEPGDSAEGSGSAQQAKAGSQMRATRALLRFLMGEGP
jgi:phospholipid/cholesterol/gamma-HCH transport system substrate-binding protein